MNRFDSVEASNLAYILECITFKSQYHDLILKDLSSSLYFSLVVSSFSNHTEVLSLNLSKG